METKILYLNDIPYKNGLKSGKYFKKIIQNEIKKMPKLNDTLYNLCVNNLNKLKKEYPSYYEEIMGKAKGANVSIIDYFILLSPEVFNSQDHCTTIMCKKNNGNFIISHNEDDNYTKENFCISKVSTKDGWFITNDIYNMPFGNGFSWNSYGILKTINYCHEPQKKLNNFSRYISQRHISEAKSIDDLIKKCNEIRPASGYHVNAIDINKNIAVSIEVYPDSIDVEYIDDYYIHSNHYIHKRYLNTPKLDKGSNSIFRLEKATELFKTISKRNLTNIKKILDYRDIEDKFETSIFQTYNDPYITGMNVNYDVEKKDKIDIYVYANRKHLILDYNLDTIEEINI